VLGCALASALAAAGVAIADPDIGSNTAVSGTFSANTSVSSGSHTCTAANGDSILLTDATFTGTASSSTPSLNGPLTINVRSAFDTKTNVGSLDARVAIGSGSAGFTGHLEGVDSNGTVQGFLEGQSAGTRILGSVTTTFSGSGFGSATAPGTIGSGTGTNSAIAMTPGCAVTTPPPPKPLPPPKPIPVQPLPPVHFPGQNGNQSQGSQGRDHDQHGPRGHFVRGGRNGRGH
jgi:hypothetical protein